MKLDELRSKLREAPELERSSDSTEADEAPLCEGCDTQLLAGVDGKHLCLSCISKRAEAQRRFMVAGMMVTRARTCARCGETYEPSLRGEPICDSCNVTLSKGLAKLP